MTKENQYTEFVRFKIYFVVFYLIKAVSKCQKKYVHPVIEPQPTPMEMHNRKKSTFSISPGCISKIPLNPPLQKGEAAGRFKGLVKYPMNSLYYKSAQELVKRIRSKDLSPIDLMDATLKNIEAVDLRQLLLQAWYHLQPGPMQAAPSAFLRAIQAALDLSRLTDGFL